jgi:hypothetical protein
MLQVMPIAGSLGSLNDASWRGAASDAHVHASPHSNRGAAKTLMVPLALDPAALLTGSHPTILSCVITSFLVAALAFELSRGGPIRSTPTPLRNDDMTERTRERIEEVEHENVAKEASRASRRDHSERGWRSLFTRIFRR